MKFLSSSSLTGRDVNTLFSLNSGNDPVQSVSNIYRLYENDEISGESVHEFTSDIRGIRNTETTQVGLSRVIEKVGNSQLTLGNYRGIKFEVKVASDTVKSGRRIDFLSKEVTTDAGSTEIDMKTKGGDLIEIKSGGRLASANAGSEPYGELSTQIAKYKQYREESGLAGDVTVTLGKEPSKDVQNRLARKNVKCLYYSGGKRRSC